MNPSNPFAQSSAFNWDEKVVTAVGNLIAPQVVCRFGIPSTLINRAVYLFLEAVPTNVAEDYQLEAAVEFYRNGAPVYSFPASVAINALGVLVTKSQLTAFVNVVAGQNEALLAKFGAPVTGGSTEATLTPQKLTLEADEVALKIIGSKNTSNSFSGWRALLAVRSVA